MHAVLTLSELIEFLVEAKCIDQETQSKVRQYIQANQVTKSVLDKSPKQSKFMFNTSRVELFSYCGLYV